VSGLRQQLIRSVAEECGGPQAVRFSPTKFEAFRICEAPKPQPNVPPRRTTFPLGEIPAASLDEALNATLAKCLLLHKDHLAIRETDERGSRTHLFAIKRRAAPDYVSQGHVWKAVHRLYAAPVCVIDGALALAIVGGGE
jgi:hypothetical protein